MRFRPFGATGATVSAVSLALTDAPNRRRAEDWRTLVISALENGVNCFEIAGVNPAIADGLAEAIRPLDRHLVFIALRLGRTASGGRDFSANHIALTCEAVIARMGVDYLDLILLDDPADDELSAEAMSTLKALRATGRSRMIGVRGKSPAMDAYISAGGFDVIATPYSLASGWIERHRLKAAGGRDMAAIGYDFFPEPFHKVENVTKVKRGLFWSKPKIADPFASAGTYAFLHDTPLWTAEEICLAFALTEPGIATVQITTEEAERLAELSAVTERDLPPGAGSRIEMARFGDHKTKSRG